LCSVLTYLQTPDDLLAALLRDLPLEVLPSTGLVLVSLPARILLGVVVDIGVDALLQSVGSGTSALSGIDAG
jgi:hypothetical protein